MDTKYLRQVFVYFISTALALFATFYILYHVLNTEMDKLETTISVSTTGQKVINTGGIIVREETPLYSAYPNAAVLGFYKNGEKVPINAEIGKAYSGERELINRIVEVENLISLLEKSSAAGKATSSDIRKYDKEIQDEVKNIIDSIQSGKLNISQQSLLEMLLNINSRKVAMKSVSDFSAAISALKSEKDALLSELGGGAETITTPQSGNVYYYVDGYETLFDYADIMNLTPAKYRELLDKQKNTAGSKRAVAKVVTNTYWYVCCEVPLSYVRDLKKGSDYNVVFTENGNAEISMTLENIVTDHESGTALLVLGTRNNPDGFDYKRHQNIRIVYGTAKGYKVPIEAVRYRNGEIGVYILDTHTIKFKKIEIIAEIDNYFIVKEQDRINDEKYYEKLGLFDVIVVSGKDFYKNKFISY